MGEMGMISKHVVVAVLAAMFCASGFVGAGEVGGTSAAAGAPGKGAAGAGEAAGYVGSPQYCFDNYASNLLTCRTAHCVSYWFWDSCDVQALKECQFAAKITLALCLAQSGG